MSDDEPNAIEVLLAAAAVDVTRAPEFVAALLDATVLVPGVAGPDNGDRPALNLATLPGRDGASIQPFYTSPGRLWETITAVPGFESHFFPFTCRRLWEITRGATLVLNPHSASGKEFPPGEIARLLDGSGAMTTHVITAETTWTVGKPARVPPGMEDALRVVFSKHSDVEGAQLGWKAARDTDDQGYLLVIIGSASTRQNITADLGRALVYFSSAAPIDVMYPQPGEANPLAALEPFYVRAKRGRLSFRR
jgi:hypothetical protein